VYLKGTLRCLVTGTVTCIYSKINECLYGFCVNVISCCVVLCIVDIDVEG